MAEDNLSVERVSVCKNFVTKLTLIHGASKGRQRLAAGGALDYDDCTQDHRHAHGLERLDDLFQNCGGDQDGEHRFETTGDDGLRWFQVLQSGEVEGER